MSGCDQTAAGRCQRRAGQHESDAPAMLYVRLHLISYTHDHWSLLQETLSGLVQAKHLAGRDVARRRQAIIKALRQHQKYVHYLAEVCLNMCAGYFNVSRRHVTCCRRNIWRVKVWQGSGRPS